MTSVLHRYIHVADVYEHTHDESMATTSQLAIISTARAPRPLRTVTPV